VGCPADLAHLHLPAKEGKGGKPQIRRNARIILALSLVRCQEKEEEGERGDAVPTPEKKGPLGVPLGRETLLTQGGGEREEI